MYADVWIIVTNKRFVVLILMEFVHIIRNLNSLYKYSGHRRRGKCEQEPAERHTSSYIPMELTL